MEEIGRKNERYAVLVLLVGLIVGLWVLSWVL